MHAATATASHLPPPASPTTATPQSAARPNVPSALWVVLVSAGVGCGALAQASGGWLGLSMALLLPVIAAAIARRARRVGTPGPAETPAREARLAQQVVPVWQRTVHAARDHAESSMSSLIESVGQISEHLEQALGQGATASLEVGAADELLQRHQPELQTLLAATVELRDLTSRAEETTQAVQAELSGLQAQAAELRGIAQVTKLLATNASVQAARAGSAGAGFNVIAQEVHAIATQTRAASEQLTDRLDKLQCRFDGLRRKAGEQDRDDDELALRAEQAARAVVRTLLGSIHDVSRSSRDLRDAGRQIHGDMERIFVALQAQDRLSQMLGSVTDDMGRYSTWLHGADDPAAATPAVWLARLEASYTMEEMRSSHHGSVVVEQAAGVEFF